MERLTTQVIFYKLGRSFVYTYSKLMLSVDICWQSQLPSGPKIIVANHPCNSDPFYLSLLFPEPISILLTENSFTPSIFGAYLRLSKHIAVSPGNGNLAFNEARALLQKGKSIAIFPEGRSTFFNGNIQTPRSGTARLALLTKSPVIPVGIYLRRENVRVLSSLIKGQPVVGYWYFRGPFAMTVGQPCYFDGDAGNRSDVRAVSEEIMKKIFLLAQESERRIREQV
jgi:1-acyl-sn-glycerol-3-phosphate acyltransferase